MQVEQFLLDLHTGRSLTETDYTRCCITTTDLWWWTRGCSKHVEIWNKHIT